MMPSLGGDSMSAMVLRKTTTHRSCGCTDAHVLNYGYVIVVWCKRHNSSISNSPDGWAAHAPDEVYEPLIGVAP